MEIFSDFMNQYGLTLLYSIVTAVIGYLGIVAKNLLKKIADDKAKKEIVRTCVRAVEQIYTDLHGSEKLEKCIESASEMLAQKGITVTEIELRMMIEAAVNEFNNQFFGKDDDGETEEE